MQPWQKWLWWRLVCCNRSRPGNSSPAQETLVQSFSTSIGNSTSKQTFPSAEISCHLQAVGMYRLHALEVRRVPDLDGMSNIGSCGTDAHKKKFENRKEFYKARLVCSFTRGDNRWIITCVLTRPPP